MHRLRSILVMVMLKKDSKRFHSRMYVQYPASTSSPTLEINSGKAYILGWEVGGGGGGGAYYQRHVGV